MDDLDRLIRTFPVMSSTRLLRADELIKAHSLRELRALAGRTQEYVSAHTGFKQNNVSRLEKRSDMDCRRSGIMSSRLAER